MATASHPNFSLTGTRSSPPPTSNICLGVCRHHQVTTTLFVQPRSVYARFNIIAVVQSRGHSQHNTNCDCILNADACKQRHLCPRHSLTFLKSTQTRALRRALHLKMLSLTSTSTSTAQ
eukprot:94170-Amphidinium_carterae.1